MKMIYLYAVVCACLFFSCRSVKEIPTDLSSAQLIQLGQDAYGNAQYKNAEKYYHTVIERFGSNASVYVEAQYELGHLYMKQKKYDKAYSTFSQLLALYNTTQPGMLPGAFHKLSHIEMAKIPEKFLPATPSFEINPSAYDAKSSVQESNAEQ